MRSIDLSGIGCWEGAIQRLQIIPWHPVLRVLLEFIGVTLQLVQIVEGIGAAQFRGMD